MTVEEFKNRLHKLGEQKTQNLDERKDALIKLYREFNDDPTTTFDDKVIVRVVFLIGVKMLEDMYQAQARLDLMNKIEQN